MPQETYFATDGVRDMFWPRPFNANFIHERCQASYGVEPRVNWIATSYGNADTSLRGYA